MHACEYFTCSITSKTSYIAARSIPLTTCCSAYYSLSGSATDRTVFIFIHFFFVFLPCPLVLGTAHPPLFLLFLVLHPEPSNFGFPFAIISVPHPSNAQSPLRFYICWLRTYYIYSPVHLIHVVSYPWYNNASYSSLQILFSFLFAPFLYPIPKLQFQHPFGFVVVGELVLSQKYSHQ